MIIKKFNINILQKNILYDIKKSYKKKVVQTMKKYFLNIFLKIGFFYILNYYF